MLDWSGAGPATVVVVPETFAGLESLSASVADKRPGVRVDSLVCAHGRRILEHFPALSTLFVHLFAVLEQVVLLQVVALFEADAAQVADEGTLLRMCPHVVPIVGSLEKVLTADGAFPNTGASRGGVHVACRYKVLLLILDVCCHLSVNPEMHSHVLLAGKRLNAHGTSERNLRFQRGLLLRSPTRLCDKRRDP